MIDILSLYSVCVQMYNYSITMGPTMGQEQCAADVEKAGEKAGGYLDG
jgi:hypothetical protein